MRRLVFWLKWPSRPSPIMWAWLSGYVCCTSVDALLGLRTTAMPTWLQVVGLVVAGAALMWARQDGGRDKHE